MTKLDRFQKWRRKPRHPIYAFGALWRNFFFVTDIAVAGISFGIQRIVQGSRLLDFLIGFTLLTSGAFLGFVLALHLSRPKLDIPRTPWE